MGKQLTYQELLAAYNKLLMENELLHKEVDRLQSLLCSKGTHLTQPIIKRHLSLEEKVDVFRNLFKGREDVFARRWYSRTSGKSGYQPVCRNEWDRQLCDKKRYKCTECPNRAFKPLEYEDIYRHLEGKSSDGQDVIGAYAILADNTCNFLCADFDDKSCEHGYKKEKMCWRMSGSARIGMFLAPLNAPVPGTAHMFGCSLNSRCLHPRHEGLEIRY